MSFEAGMPPDALGPILPFLRSALAEGQPNKPLIVGLCGAQGSGKSTVSAHAVLALKDEGYRVLAFSLDDLYLTRAERNALASDVHPLLRTRGVPGTHDVALGQKIFDAAARAEFFFVPRFDKAVDDRSPAEEWPICDAPLDLVLLEGWCVGALPQPTAALIEPTNELERREEPRGIWRNNVNEQLDGPYRRLYRYLERLILLAAPDFSVVHRWRKQQESTLREHTAMSGGRADTLMDDAALDWFISHYERITRHILDYMPSQADLVVQLTDDRTIRF